MNCSCTSESYKAASIRCKNSIGCCALVSVSITASCPSTSTGSVAGLAPIVLSAHKSVISNL